MIIEIITIIGILALIIIWRFLRKKIGNLEKELKKSQFAVRSAYVKFGKTFEQFAPFTKDFSQEEKNGFIFLGCPLDGIIFGDDMIKFVEIKTGNAKLSSKQEKIKKMIENNQIEFKEVRY